MTIKITFMILLYVLLTGISYGAGNIYTWIDDQGVLNITDARPPAGAKIIDTSPSYREQAMQIEQAKRERQQARIRELARQNIEKLVDQYRKKEAAAREKADALHDKAETLDQDKGTWRYRRWAHRRAKVLSRQADQADDNADMAAQKAEKYEDMLKDYTCTGTTAC